MHPFATARARSHALVLGLGALVAAGLLARPEGAQTQAQPARALLGGPGGGNADSNNRMIAVTGTDLTGASILYLVDTENMQLAVYQATGGSSSTQGLKLVGARRISLDLQLDGFNDRSEFTYKDLRREFESKGLLEPEEDVSAEEPDEEG